MTNVPGVDIAVRRELGTIVVDVAGEVDITGSAKLSGVVRDLVEEGATSLVLDMSEVTFLDSTGLSALISGRNRCRAKGGDLTLRGPSPAAWKVLTITGLDQVFTLDAS
jgi:anti-sigma B factor antagonist